MHNYKRFLNNPWEILRVLGAKGYLTWIPDRTYLRIMYHAKLGKKLNLANPITYNEKIQWLKLYNRNPQYTMMVDKFRVKQYVCDKVGSQYVIPLLGVWDSPEDIDISILPDQFVLKCNHDSGTVIICKDKANFDINGARKYLKKKMNRNYYRGGREWPYKNVERKIIAEPYLEDKKTGELRDYKFFCFNGKAKLLFVATDRQNQSSETCFDFFDINYKHLNVRNGHPNANRLPEKPISFDLMIRLAEKLSEGIPHVRIDF